jgi:hypothetical protein
LTWHPTTFSNDDDENGSAHEPYRQARSKRSRPPAPRIMVVSSVAAVRKEDGQAYTAAMPFLFCFSKYPLSWRPVSASPIVPHFARRHFARPSTSIRARACLPRLLPRGVGLAAARATPSIDRRRAHGICLFDWIPVCSVKKSSSFPPTCCLDR